MPKAGKPPRSLHDWLCKFCLMIGCVGFASRAHRIRTATMASAENATNAISRRVMPSRRNQRSENRQRSRRRNRSRWRHRRKRWGSFGKRRRNHKNPHNKRQMRRPRQHTKMTIKAFGQLQTAGLFSDDHRAIKSLKAELDKAKAAGDESVPLSKRIRAGQNQVAMHERHLKAANERVEEAEQSIVAAQQSLEQHRAHREGAAGATEPPGTSTPTSCSRSVPRSGGRTAPPPPRTSQLPKISCSVLCMSCVHRSFMLVFCSKSHRIHVRSPRWVAAELSGSFAPSRPLKERFSFIWTG